MTAVRRHRLPPSLGLAAALCASIAGCRSPLGLDPSPRGEQVGEAQRSALTSDRLSAATTRILEWEGLPPRATPEAAARLRDKASGTPDAEQLLALAEVSYAIGMGRGGGAGPGWDDIAVATLASWSALFHPELRLSPYGPQWSLARTLHNAALGEMVAGRPELPGNAEAHLQCTILDDPIEFDYRWEAEAWSPEAFRRFLPADSFRVRGMRNRNGQPGFGAPLLGERVVDDSTPIRPTEERLPPDYQTVALTAVVSDVRFPEGASWPPTSFTLRIHDPTDTPTASVAGRDVPLEADFTAALTHTLGRNERLRGAGFGGLRHVEHWESLAGLYMLEPFDQDRIPVVFSHGLVSSPIVWREMINDLWADPQIRRRYQFWFFMYPTGNPFAYSAAMLRRELEQVRRLHDPDRACKALDQIVLVGHSMGGLVSRLLVTDPGDALWASVSDVPFDEATLDDDDRALLREVLFFKPYPGATRVVFIATPHRGSGFADSIGRIGAALVNLPPTLLDAATRVFEQNPDTIRLSSASSPLRTSIDTLSPRSPLLLALADLPIAPGVHAHSIIGRRSGGDGPGGTDGVVRFESAHVPGVESELIIAGADHGVPLHPAATREMRRILLEHAAAVGGTR